MCHKKGFSVMHIRACCQYSGLQYINSDGTIDQNVIDNYGKEKT